MNPERSRVGCQHLSKSESPPGKTDLPAMRMAAEHQVEARVRRMAIGFRRV